MGIICGCCHADTSSIPSEYMFLLTAKRLTSLGYVSGGGGGREGGFPR